MIKRIHYYSAIKSNLLSNNSFHSIPTILFNLLQSKGQNFAPLHQKCLENLMIVLEYLPNLLKNHLNRITEILSEFLYSKNEKNRRLTCKIFSLLPQLFKSSQNPQNLFHEFFQEILTNLNHLICLLFDKVDCLLDNSFESVYFQQKIHPPGTNEHYFNFIEFFNLFSKLKNQKEIQENYFLVNLLIKSLFDVLKNIFTITYLIPVEVSPKKLLDFFKRIFLIDPRWLLKQKRNNQINQNLLNYLIAFLPEIQKNSLKILKNFVKKLNTSLLPYSLDIAALLTKILPFYEIKKTPFHQEILKEIFKISFDCLAIFRYNVFSEFGIYLIKFVLIQFTDLFLLNQQNTQIFQLNVNSSKKKRKRSYMNSDNHANSTISVLEDQIPQNDCFDSLFFHLGVQILEISILTCASAIPADLRNEINQFLLHFLLPYSNSSVVSIYSPLSNDLARFSLFKLLQASILNENSADVHSILPYATVLFNLAQNDSFPPLCYFSISALSVSNALLHPTRPPVLPLARDLNAQFFHLHPSFPSSASPSTPPPASNNAPSLQPSAFAVSNPTPAAASIFSASITTSTLAFAPLADPNSPSTSSTSLDSQSPITASSNSILLFQQQKHQPSADFFPDSSEDSMNTSFSSTPLSTPLNAAKTPSTPLSAAPIPFNQSSTPLQTAELLHESSQTPQQQPATTGSGTLGNGVSPARKQAETTNSSQENSRKSIEVVVDEELPDFVSAGPDSDVSSEEEY